MGKTLRNFNLEISTLSWPLWVYRSTLRGGQGGMMYEKNVRNFFLIIKLYDIFPLAAIFFSPPYKPPSPVPKSCVGGALYMGVKKYGRQGKNVILFYDQKKIPHIFLIHHTPLDPPLVYFGAHMGMVKRQKFRFRNF